MRLPVLLVLPVLASLATAMEAPMLIPLGTVELPVRQGETASAPLAQERHQSGLLRLRPRQQGAPLEFLVLLRVQGGPVTVTVRPAVAGSAPLATAVVAVGDGIMRMPLATPADLVLEATTEGAGAQVDAVAYGDFLQPGIQEALAREVGGEGDPDEAVEKDPALQPFAAEARNLKQLMVAMIAFQADAETWPMLAVEGIPVPPQTPEQARLLTAAAFELLARRMQLPPALFVSPAAPGRVLPPPRSEAEIAARPDPAWAEDYAYDWAVPEESASYRVVLAGRRFAEHPKLGLGVTVAFADGGTRFLPVVRSAEVQGLSTAGLSGFGDGLLPAVPNPDAAGVEDREGDDAAKAAVPDNIFDDHGDGAGGTMTPGRGDPRRAFVK